MEKIKKRVLLSMVLAIIKVDDIMVSDIASFHAVFDATRLDAVSIHSVSAE